MDNRKKGLSDVIELENESGVYVSVQLTKPTVQIGKVVRDTSPEVCLLCGSRSKSSFQLKLLQKDGLIATSFTISQVDKLIEALNTLKDAALRCEKGDNA